MNTKIDVRLIDGDYFVDAKKVRDMPFGEGLSFAPCQTRDTYSSGGWVIKDGKLIATCDFSPIGSCEDSGYFLTVANPEKGTYRICNSKGEIFRREFGKHSGPFVNKIARIHIIDEPVEKEKLHHRGDYSLFTFAKVDKEGKLKFMKHRFACATFMDEAGLARVIMVGEKNYAYVTRKGKLLPYRFSNAEDFFRDGLAPVTLLNGFHAFIRSDGNIVKITKSGDIKVLLTPEEYQKQMEENGQIEIPVNEGLTLTQWIERDLTYDI